MAETAVSFRISSRTDEALQAIFSPQPEINLMHLNETEEKTTTMRNRKYDVQIGPGRKLGARLLVAPEENKAGLAIVLHTLPPRSLAAPPHRHSREDEFSYVLEGELTVWEEGDVARVRAGEAIVKGRDILHTFWNEGPNPLRFLEIITPGNFANFFRDVDTVQPDGPFQEDDIQRISRLNERYGLVMDFGPVPDLMEQHGLEP